MSSPFKMPGFSGYGNESPVKQVALIKKGISGAIKVAKEIKKYAVNSGIIKNPKLGGKGYKNKNPYDLKNYNKLMPTRKSASQTILGTNKSLKVKKGPYNNEHGFQGNSSRSTNDFSGFHGRYNN